MKGNFFFNSKNFKYAFFSLTILYTYYFLPFVTYGSFLTSVHDGLDSAIPYNHIAGKIILGDFQAINIFLGGEWPWQFLKGVFYPITIIYSLFETEKAFWITDVLVKTLAFFSFLYLLKKINLNQKNYSNYYINYLLALFFASSNSFTLVGLGLATMPYIAGLLLKDKELNLKNYFAVCFIGLNTDLYVHGIYILPIIFFIFYIFRNKNKKQTTNLIILLIVYLLSLFISNSPIIYSIIYLRPFHSEEIIRSLPTFKENIFLMLNKLEVFSFVYFYKNFFLTFLVIFIFIYSFFKKIKINTYILFFILAQAFLTFLLNIDFIDNLRSHSKILTATNFDRFNQFNTFFYTICLFFIFIKTEFKFKKLLVSVVCLCITYNILAPNLRTIAANAFGYYTLNEENKKIIINNYKNFELVKLMDNLKKFNQNSSKNKKKSVSTTSSSFRDFYMFEDYGFIKKIVREERVLSIGLDSITPVMSGINIIDGYYYVYPLSYKKKFAKIMSKEFEQLSKKESAKFYNWGHMLKVKIKNDKNILVDFEEAKKLGAQYVIINRPIETKLLTLICKKCNDNENLNLYKIN